MRLNVVESVLGNIGNTGVRVLPHISFLGHNFTDKELDHGRLSSSVLSDTGNTRTERHLNSDVEKSGLGVSRISEGTVCHLHECLSLGLHTLDRSRNWELELQLGRFQGKVRAGSGVNLYILVEVSLVSSQLQVVERKNVSTAIVEQTGIVTDNDGSDILQGVEVGLDPGNVDNICKENW